MGWMLPIVCIAKQTCPRLEEICNRAPDQSKNVCHRQKASPNIGPLESQIRFAVGTSVPKVFIPQSARAVALPPCC